MSVYDPRKSICDYPAAEDLAAEEDFGRKVKHAPENTGRQEKGQWQCVTMQIKLKRHLEIEFRLTKVIGANFRAIVIVV